MLSNFDNTTWKLLWLHAFVVDSELAKIFDVIGIPKPILVDGNRNMILATEGELRGEFGENAGKGIGKQCDDKQVVLAEIHVKLNRRLANLMSRFNFTCFNVSPPSLL